MEIPKTVISWVHDWIDYHAKRRCDTYIAGEVWNAKYYEFCIVYLSYEEATHPQILAANWAVKNGLFEHVKTVGSLGLMRKRYFMPTSKFYFDFVLPHIAKEKDRVGNNWLMILIADSAYRNKGGKL